MERKNFILSTLLTLPLIAFANLKINLRSNKGFKVGSGEARFGKHFKMKGITINLLDTKISGKDTDNDLVVFEQTGLTQKGGPPLHIHPNQDEWFYIIEGEYRGIDLIFCARTERASACFACNVLFFHLLGSAHAALASSP